MIFAAPQYIITKYFVGCYIGWAHSTVNFRLKEKTRFTFDTAIDTFQTGKKTFVNTVFAKNEKVATALNQFVDAQTAYTKAAVKAGTDVGAKLAEEGVKLAQEAMKFDFTKAFQVKR